MDITPQTLADLEKAEQAFNRVIGKHDYGHAFELLAELKLGEQADDIVLGVIENAFARDAFAGFLRYDGVVQRIQIEIIRLKRASESTKDQIK